MKETFQVIMDSLQECGYSVSYEVLDARGPTATTRKQLYIVGLRQVEGNLSIFEFPFVRDLSLRAQNVIDYDSEHDQALAQISSEHLHRLCSEKYWKPAHVA